MIDSRGKALAWLGHPASVAALVLLIVNDHVLKAAHPGWVTGKLSDVAGMIFAPPLIAALLGWSRSASMVAVGVGFTFVKTSAYGAELASAVWSLITPSLVRADPTDLLALPFLGVAWWASARAVDRRWLRALRLAVILPLALLGVAATSAVPTPRAESVTVDPDGALYLYAFDSWSVSRDAGRTFVDSAGPRDGKRSDCARSEPVVCYRVVPNRLAVESRSGDGPWQRVWGFSDAEFRTLERGYAHEDSTWLGSEELTVLDVPSGHVVAVANGRDGFAIRDADGTWRRIGFPADPHDMAPLSLPAAEQQVRDGRKAAALPLGLTLFTLISGLIITFTARQPMLMIPQAAVGGPVLLLTLAATRSDLMLDFAVVWWLPVPVVVAVFSFAALSRARAGFAASLTLVGTVVLGMGGALWLWSAFGAGHVLTLVPIMVAAAAAVIPAAARVL